MTDWAKIEVKDFMDLVRSDEHVDLLVGRIVLDRLPFTFDSKAGYFLWRHELGSGFQVDARDVVLVGSAAIGRSLNPQKRFKVFGSQSDIDIAVVSPTHFDRAWHWFRNTDPLLLHLDGDTRRTFDQHKKQYIFEGMVAANVFLGYLPFGQDWLRTLQRCERYLPPLLRGRVQTVRIYKDNQALREAQARSLQAYRNYLANKSSS
ncbi:hypothetical protein HH310_40930 [Actinoplanes sp. TBRC 11911]|uniref:hypothetical protein n=1 Tax=Actinoplanes sp. TBRC 11911 TaxID=2729386 RepID=UPI00145C7999|nr:hypothetical protein [Actinoplanes sp. TBRC 11911]NMO57520.1 hypothetical protein [Actinoplanes sp. TBRC 11911]